MSQKEILVPFDLEKAKAGAKLRDRDGNNCRLVCDNMNTSFGTKIVVVVSNYDNTEKLRVLYPNGQALKDELCHDDVLIVEEVEEPDRWLDRMDGKVKGWCLAYNGKAVKATSNDKEKCFWKSIFATKKQAQAAAAAVLISQIMANDKRFGGVVTDEEWQNDSVCKYVILRSKCQLKCEINLETFALLAFHTEKQRDLFFQENRDLVRQYFML